jgi:hypothetical protein
MLRFKTVSSFNDLHNLYSLGFYFLNKSKNVRCLLDWLKALPMLYTGWNHTKPPKNCSFKYVFFFCNNVFLVMYGHHILNYFFLIEVYMVSFKLNLINYFEKSNKYWKNWTYEIIFVTKFENLNIYFKTKVVDGIFGWIFLWCMILIYIN